MPLENINQTNTKSNDTIVARTFPTAEIWNSCSEKLDDFCSCIQKADTPANVNIESISICLMFLTDAKDWEQTDTENMQEDRVHNLISTQPINCLFYKIKAYK